MGTSDDAALRPDKKKTPETSFLSENEALIFRLTFLTLFFVIDSTANTWSPIDDSSIATRCSAQDTSGVYAVVVCLILFS